MLFRKFNAVLSDDFEWSLLLGAINYYINEMQKKGIDAGDVVKARDKLIFYSCIIEKGIEAPFEQ